MNIEKRRIKPFSDRLYNELCFLCLLINSDNRAYLYILKTRFKKSKRTYYRYAHDLYQSGVTPIININKTDRYKFFNISEIEESYFDYYEFAEYLINYINNHDPIINNAKSSKLRRTSLLLLHNINNFISANSMDDDDNVIYPTLVNGNIYGFYRFDKCDYLYSKTSKRTQEREIAIVKKAISYMYES